MMNKNRLSQNHFLSFAFHTFCIALILGSISGCMTKPSAPENSSHSAVQKTTPSDDVTHSMTPSSPLPDVTVIPDATPLLRLAVISDMNGRYGSAEYDAEVVKAIDKIIAEHPDIVINAGDMVAGQKPKLNYKKMWAGFHANVTQRLKDAGIPMAQVVGNHDGSAYAKYAVERQTYIDEWTAHKPDLPYVDDTAYPLYYSFVFRDVFFIALDASTLDPLDNVQFEWLQNQLKNNPTSNRPIVFFHVPLFPITTIKPTEILRDSRLEPLFAQNHVQLVITGHQQAYFPAALNGVVYLHAGALGGGPRPVRQNDGIAPKTLTFVNIYKDYAPYIDSHLVNSSTDQHFDHNLLPTYIVFGNKILPRIDISMENAKFAHEYMISPHMPKIQMETLIDALKANEGDWSRIPSWNPNDEPENKTAAPLSATPDSASENPDKFIDSLNK